MQHMAKPAATLQRQVLEEVGKRAEGFMAGFHGRVRTSLGGVGQPCSGPLPETSLVVEGKAAVEEEHGQQQAATH